MLSGAYSVLREGGEFCFSDMYCDRRRSAEIQQHAVAVEEGLGGALYTEDYGQVAVYKGSIPEHPHFYDLDEHHRFCTGKPVLVSGNSACMVGESWLGKHFRVIGDRSTHYGKFERSPVQ